MENTEILSKVIQSFLSAVGRKTSTNFSLKTFDYILERYKDIYDILEYISVGKNPLDDSIAVEVESTVSIRQVNIRNINNFLEIIFKQVFKEIIQDERYYSTDIESIIKDVREDVGNLFEELGINIKWRHVIQGAQAETKLTAADVSFKKYKNKSQVLGPLINTLIDLVYEGILKKNKKRKDAVEIIVNVIRELEKKHKLFGLMLLEDIEKEKVGYNIKTQWKIEDVFFFNSSDEYAVKAVSKIDNIENDTYNEAMKELILNVGDYINFQDKPFFIKRLKERLDEAYLEKFLELGIDLNEIEDILKKQGYNDVVKKTFYALIKIIESNTSTNFAVVALDTIFQKLKETEDKEILRYINIDKNLSDKGIESINISSEINKEDPYKIAKTIGNILRKTQENRKNHSERASFINDLKMEMGERYFAELDNMGVNVHLINMRYI